MIRTASTSPAKYHAAANGQRSGRAVTFGLFTLLTLYGFGCLETCDFLCPIRFKAYPSPSLSKNRLITFHCGVDCKE